MPRKHELSQRMSGATEAEQRPLDFPIVRRIFAYTAPYGRLRNALFFLVVLRSIQLPLVAWATAKVVSGPISRHDARGTLLGVLGYLGLAGFTSACFVYRSRLALLLGEAVVHGSAKKVPDFRWASGKSCVSYGRCSRAPAS
jgi:hypothetical protein